MRGCRTGYEQSRSDNHGGDGDPFHAASVAVLSPAVRYRFNGSGIRSPRRPHGGLNREPEALRHDAVASAAPVVSFRHRPLLSCQLG
jgi:hypothetical protein